MLIEKWETNLDGLRTHVDAHLALQGLYNVVGLHLPRVHHQSPDLVNTPLLRLNQGINQQGMQEVSIGDTRHTEAPDSLAISRKVWWTERTVRRLGATNVLTPVTEPYERM